MASSQKKIIAVVGATGNQGSGVANHFATLPNWRVRALTRDPSSDKAKALAAKGVELVKAELDDVPSLEAAFAGAHAIFINLDFTACLDSIRKPEVAAQPEHILLQLAADKEIQRTKNALAAASKDATLERLVYSGFVSPTKISGGKYTNVPHWESKAAVVAALEAKEFPELAGKWSILYCGGYVDLPLFIPQRDPATGKYVLVLPMSLKTRMPAVDPVEATGPYVRALVEDEEVGTRLLTYNTDSYLTVEEALAAFSRVTGKEVQYVQASVEEMSSKYGLPLGFAEILGFVGEFGYADPTGPTVMEPPQLKTKVVTRTYEEALRDKHEKGLIIKE